MNTVRVINFILVAYVAAGSTVHVYLFIHAFIHLFIYSFIYLFIYLLTYKLKYKQKLKSYIYTVHVWCNSRI